MSEFNRRKFLEGSAGVAAAATIGAGATVFSPLRRSAREPRCSRRARARRP